MQLALESVASRAPHLHGRTLVQALAATGWVDEATAARLLPTFRQFDPDRFFAESLRRLSFGGAPAAPEFRLRVARIVADLTGNAEIVHFGSEEAIQFRCGEREGVVFAYPEVALTIGGTLRAAIGQAVEAMPDVLVLVARNFTEGTAGQLKGMLAGTEVPGTLVTVNLLLGMRGTALRYQPPIDQVIDLLGAGRSVRSADIAGLGNSPVRGRPVVSLIA